MKNNNNNNNNNQSVAIIKTAINKSFGLILIILFSINIPCTIHEIQSTLPTLNLLGLKKYLRLRENSTYEGLKTIEYKEKRT